MNSFLFDKGSWRERLSKLVSLAEDRNDKSEARKGLKSEDIIGRLSLPVENGVGMVWFARVPLQH